MEPRSACETGFSVLGAANLTLKFLLEVSAIAAFAYWGANTGEMPLSLILAIAAPVAAIAAWAVLAAPKSTRRLSPQTRIPFEITVFVAAVLALLATGAAGAAAVMAVLVVLNAVALTALGQWEH